MRMNKWEVVLKAMQPWTPESGPYSSDMQTGNSFHVDLPGSRFKGHSFGVLQLLCMKEQRTTFEGAPPIE